MKYFITHPWPWWFSGIMISVVMFMLIFNGKQFSFSSNFRTMCAAMGAGKKFKFFDYKWKTQRWNLMFLVGAMIGGFVAKSFLSIDRPIKLSRAFEKDLANMRMLPPRITDSLNRAEKIKNGSVGSIEYPAGEYNSKNIKKQETETKDIFSDGPIIQPDEIFGKEAAMSLKGFSILAIGGLLIGFGSRYAGGCTSGHAISGLSNLQLPSLVAVIGFFIGGLIMVHFIIPFIF